MANRCGFVLSDGESGMSQQAAFDQPDIRQLLIEYLDRIAGWRRQRAQEYDRDDRNVRTADALDALAEHIRALPDDDPRLAHLARLTLRGDVFEPGQQLHYEIGRFRFHHPEATVESFFDMMIELARTDANEHGHFGGPQVPGDEPWR